MSHHISDDDIKPGLTEEIEKQSTVITAYVMSWVHQQISANTSDMPSDERCFKSGYRMPSEKQGIGLGGDAMVVTDLDEFEAELLQVPRVDTQRQHTSAITNNICSCHSRSRTEIRGMAGTWTVSALREDPHSGTND